MSSELGARNSERCRLDVGQASVAPRSALRVPRFLLLFAVFFNAALPAFGIAPLPASSEVRFLSGLRERRLFELAEAYCRRQLAEAGTSPRRRSELVVELARSIVDSALFAPAAEREIRFAAALRTLDEVHFERADDPWKLPLDAQRGLTELLHGELLLEDWRGLSITESAAAAARDRLRSAVAQLRRTHDDVEQRRIRLGTATPSSSTTTTNDDPTETELASLRRNVGFQLARAYRLQGESYPAGSPDRAAALDQAVAALEPLARSDADDALAWQARLDEAACRRLAGLLDEADRALERLVERTPPRDVADRARAERIRLRIDAAEPDEAETLLREEDFIEDGLVDPDLRLAIVELRLAQARSAATAGRTDDSRRFMTAAQAATDLIARRHTAAWHRRAERLSAANATALPGGDAGPLIAAADALYLQGNAAGALELYDRAVAQAAADGDVGRAFEAGLRAAAVEQQRGRFAAAAEHYFAAAARQPDHPRAAEAHLAGIFALAENLRVAASTAGAAARDASSVDSLFASYAGRLSDQVERWPTDPTASTAWYWLGLLRRRQGDDRAACAAFANVASDAPVAADAVAQLAASYHAQLARAPVATRPALLAEAETSLGRYGAAPSDALADSTKSLARRAARWQARLTLEFADDRFAATEAVLTQLRETADDEAERASLDAWLIVADVGRGQMDAAAQRAVQLTAPLADDDAAVVGRLDQLMAQQPAETRTRTAAILLRLLDLSRPASSDARRSAMVARALAAAGRTDEARQTWKTLAAAHPADRRLQTEYAEFLLTQPGRAAGLDAVAKWRELGRGVAEGSAEWYRARLGLARAYLQAGDAPRAAQLIELTEALHPDLGGEATKAEFERLRQTAEGK